MLIMHVKSLLSHEKCGCNDMGLFVVRNTCALPFLSTKTYVGCNQWNLIKKTVLLGTLSTCLTCMVSE